MLKADQIPFEAVYTDGDRRTRLLLRRRPSRAISPTGEVDGLSFSRKAGGNTLYTVTFTHGSVSHRYGHHISEIVRVEETAIGVSDKDRGKRTRADGAAPDGLVQTVEYTDGGGMVRLALRRPRTAPEVSGEIDSDLRTFEQFGGKVIVVAFTHCGLRRFHKYPVHALRSLEERGIKGSEG